MERVQVLERYNYSPTDDMFAPACPVDYHRPTDPTYSQAIVVVIAMKLQNDQTKLRSAAVDDGGRSLRWLVGWLSLSPGAVYPSTNSDPQQRQQ